MTEYKYSECNTLESLVDTFAKTWPKTVDHLSIVDAVYAQLGMVAADLVPGVIGGEPESAREREYRQKQEALQKAEHDRNQEQARRLREAGEVLSRDYTQPHDHKLGWLR